MTPDDPGAAHPGAGAGPSRPTTAGLGPDGGIDPRGPRFAAAVTAGLLLVALVLGLAAPLDTPPAERIAQPGFLLLALLAALFAWSAARGVTRGPWSAVFRRLVRPRLAPPAALESPRPPRFAQGVGLAVTGLGVVLHLVGVPLAVPVAAGAAFAAAFLNAAFDYCLGCELYLVLVRVGLLGRPADSHPLPLG